VRGQIQQYRFYQTHLIVRDEWDDEYPL